MFNVDDIKITPEILNLIAEIDYFKGAWLQVGILTPDRLSALRKIATIESIGSSTRIEGSKLSDSEVEALLNQVDVRSLQNRDDQEVAGYALACNKIFEHFDSIAFSENSIKQIHSWLLQYSEKDQRHRDRYKNIPIRIEAFDPKGKSLGTLFETMSPMETPIKMCELVKSTKRAIEEKQIHPLLITPLFIVLFLAIHPFNDGNGCLSRLLTTLLMLKFGYPYVAYSSLESIIEANKESYYMALQQTQNSWQKGDPDWTPWILFFLRCLQRQKSHLEVKIEHEKIIAVKLPLLSIKVLNALMLHGPLNIGKILALTKGNRNTLKKQLEMLVKNNYITMHGKGKGSTYSIKVTKV